MRVEDLMLTREVAGLRLSLKTHIAVAIVVAVAQLNLFQNDGIAYYLLLFGSIAGLCGFLLYILDHSRARYVGITLVVVDVALMVGVPLAWYGGFGEAAGSRAFFYQMPLFAVFALALTFSAVPLRPLYVISTGVGGIIAHLVLWNWIVADPMVTAVPLIEFTEQITYVASERLPGGFLILILMTVTLLAITTMARRLTVDASEQEQKHGQLSRYFSPTIAAQIEAGDGSETALDEAEKDVIVLMTDIRGFTELTAKFGPRGSVALLSGYFDCMVPPIFSHAGTVDKFIGDSVLAVFGAPLSTGHDADDALAAATEMQAGLKTWNQARRDAGDPPVTHVIALHAGPAIVGTVGSVGRREYTVVGDTVNGASRILEQCKGHNAPVLASQAFIDRLSKNPAIHTHHICELRGLGEVNLAELDI